MPNTTLANTFFNHVDTENYAALIYYVDRATGENELTVITRDYKRDVIDDSLAEQASQALLQELEIQAVHPLSSEKVAFIYLPDSAEATYLSDSSGQGKEIRTMAIAKAIALIADFDSLGIKAISFDFDGYDGAIDIINADTKEPLVLDGGSEKAMFESIFNALHKDRFIERVESGNAIIDFQNNEIKGNFVELIGESKCSTVSKDKELLTKDELDFFDELNKAQIDQVLIEYDGSGDSSDGLKITYHDENKSEIVVPNQVNDDVERFINRLLISEFGYWFDNNGAEGTILVNVKDASYEIEHERFFDIDQPGTLGTKTDQENVSDLMHQLLNPQTPSLPSPTM